MIGTNAIDSILQEYKNELIRLSNTAPNNKIEELTQKLEKSIKDSLEKMRAPRTFSESLITKNTNKHLDELVKYGNLTSKRNISTYEKKLSLLASIEAKLPQIEQNLSYIDKLQRNKPLHLSKEEDERLFKQEFEETRRLNPLYKIYIDKDTGEIIISDKIGKTQKELENLEEIKNQVSNEQNTPDYNYLENYTYTSSYQELGLKLNNEIQKSGPDQAIPKTTLERYKEYTENDRTNEMEEFLEKE